MNILIVAKIYHQNGRARAIQMRRVVEALVKYTSHDITLITESKNSEVQDILKVINILPNKNRLPQIRRFLNRFVIEQEVLMQSHFVKETALVAKKLISENGIDLLYTVSTPIDSHLAGLEIKKSFPNLKWITFFSDIWPLNLLPKPYYRKKLLSHKEETLTKNIISACDTVIVPSLLAVKMLNRKFKTNKKIYSIPHCLGNSNSQKNNTLRKGFIVHAGALQKERINKDLIEAIKELSNESNDFKGFVHIGSYDKSLKKLIEQYKCQNFKLIGNLPENDANSLQAEFPIGIIIEGKMGDISPFMPSKITDSILLHEKIICITPKNSFLTEFCQNYKGLFSCEYKKDNIKKSILQALKNQETIGNDSIEYFHPNKIAYAYDQLFLSVI